MTSTQSAPLVTSTTWTTRHCVTTTRQRAAQLTRVLDGAAVRRAPKKSNPRSSQIKWIATVLVIAAAASWAMVEFSGARGTGETASGEIRQGTTTLLADAAQAFGGGDPERAIELYGEVLDLQPTNVEALTYRGWISYQTGDVDGARADFDEAVAFDAEYGDVRVFSRHRCPRRRTLR